MGSKKSNKIVKKVNSETSLKGSSTPLKTVQKKTAPTQPSSKGAKPADSKSVSAEPVVFKKAERKPEKVENKQLSIPQAKNQPNYDLSVSDDVDDDFSEVEEVSTIRLKDEVESKKAMQDINLQHFVSEVRKVSEAEQVTVDKVLEKVNEIIDGQDNPQLLALQEEFRSSFNEGNDSFDRNFWLESYGRLGLQIRSNNAGGMFSDLQAITANTTAYMIKEGGKEINMAVETKNENTKDEFTHSRQMAALVGMEGVDIVCDSETTLERLSLAIPSLSSKMMVVGDTPEDQTGNKHTTLATSWIRALLNGADDVMAQTLSVHEFGNRCMSTSSLPEALHDQVGSLESLKTLLVNPAELMGMTKRVGVEFNRIKEINDYCTTNSKSLSLATKHFDNFMSKMSNSVERTEGLLRDTEVHAKAAARSSEYMYHKMTALDKRLDEHVTKLEQLNARSDPSESSEEGLEDVTRDTIYELFESYMPGMLETAGISSNRLSTFKKGLRFMLEEPKRVYESRDFRGMIKNLQITEE